MTIDRHTIDADRLNRLTQLARRIYPATDQAPVVLSSRSGRIVMRLGPIVVKVHGVSADYHDLKVRLQLLAQAPLDEIFLPPLPYEDAKIGEPLTTVWPAGEPVDPSLEQIPWQAAASLLARLHQCSLPTYPFPTCRAAKRVTVTLTKLKTQSRDSSLPDLRAVLSAAETLRFTDRHRVSLVHGDWHLGQMVAISRCGAKSWRLIDAEDMGLGDPAWDLARPAAFFAAGLISPDDWVLFLDSYRAAGGLAVQDYENPWLSLDMPARALVVQCAAQALIKSIKLQTPLSDAERPLIDACRRIIFQEKLQ